MEFEQLQLQSVRLLEEKVGNCGLPEEDDEEIDDAPSLSYDGVSPESLSAALSELTSRECELITKATDCNEAAALRGNVARLRNMQERVADCQQRMRDLRASYEAVTSRTSSLHDACDRAMAQQTILAAAAEQIRANLHYFKQADIIMKKLSTGSKLLVTGQSFTGILASIDECLQFLRAHPEYRESEEYITKFEQCLSRAMTWIRGSVLGDIDAAVQDVRNRQAAREGKVEKQHFADEETLTLLYGVFASRAESVKSALSVAESRFGGVAEFEAMLAECQQVYFSTRQQLLYPIVEATLSQLASSHAESSCTLTRSGCSFLLRVIDDEFRVYRQFFFVDDRGAQSRAGSRTPGYPLVHSPTSNSFFWSAISSFDEYVEGICRLLYNMLRPIVVHNPHLETLTELCAILKVEMIEQRCSLMASMLVQGERSFDPRGGFVRIMGELVGDISERLVYRASLYAESEIANYRPSPGDLAYPEKLEMMKNIEKGENKKLSVSAPSLPEGTVVTQESGVSGAPPSEGGDINPPSSPSPSSVPDATSPPPSASPSASAPPTSAVDLHCLWYPTVRRTVMCLAKLFKYLDMGVFQSLARELLSACIQSLDTAAQAICDLPKRQGSWPRTIDAQLFLVKHLLILREQTAPYRQAAIHRSDPSMNTRDLSIDFSKIRNSASQFMADRDRWFEFSSNNAFLEFLFQVPIHVSEQSGDSRRVIDVHLRQRCNRLVEISAELLVKDLAAFVDKAEKESSKEGFDLKNYPELSPKELQNVSALSFKQLTVNWQLLRSALSLYIGVSETEQILLTPIRHRVSDVWGRVHGWTRDRFDQEGNAIAALPALAHIHVLINKP